MTQSATAARPFEGVQVPPVGTYSFDLSHSHVGFQARHLMVSKTRGVFSSFDGQITIGEDPLASKVEVSIDVNSVDSRDENRDAHLRSADFFDAESFPTIRFVSTAVRHLSGEEFEVDGELTVRDVTRPLTLPVTLEGVTTDPWGNDRIAFATKLKVNREDWGLTWNQALETGGFVVSKEITIDIEVEATRNA